MRLIDAPRGSFVTRNWYLRNDKDKLRIYVEETVTDTKSRPRCIYVSSNQDEVPGIVTDTSTAWGYDDFVLCDRYGNVLINQNQNQNQKDNTMAHPGYNSKVIVVTNSNLSASFNTEAEALEWIADKLEEAPRTKFKMFKPYQSIEPQVPDLSSLIKKIVD